MKKLLLFALFTVLVFIISDYVRTIQTASAGWGPPGGGGYGGGATASKTPPGRPSRPIPKQTSKTTQKKRQLPAQEEDKKVVLSWEEIQVDYPVEDDFDEDSQDEDLEPFIKQFETAEEDQKPIIIYIYTCDMRKKAKAKREACEKFYNDVLCDCDIAEQLEDFQRLQCDIDKIDEDKELKKKYKLSTSTPAIVLYYFNGKKYTSTRSTNINTVKSKLKTLIKKNKKAVEKLEKKKAKLKEKAAKDK